MMMTDGTLRVLQLQEELLSAHGNIEALYLALRDRPWHTGLLREMAEACQAREALWRELRTVMDRLLDLSRDGASGARPSPETADAAA